MKIKRGSPVDISAIYVLLNQMHKETTLQVAPINSRILISKITEAIYQGVVFLTHNDKEITGSVGGLTGTDWWSDKPFLGDLWFYVKPEHRKSRAAFMLMKEFLKVGKTSNMSTRVGHIFSGDIERKDSFYEHFGFKKAGSVYLMEI
tara:strand:+ start:273 stop:713 length:441 start_codon:yes stop_codon:yes gene_type:complete